MSIDIDLYKVFDKTESINVYNDGEVNNYVANQKQFEEILISWNNMIDGAHEMPAYGVSLNRETLKALNSGLWVEFVFDGVYESNGMPYEKLLIQVEKAFTGFNLIRYSTEYGYDGRCFYYDLANRNMDNLYDILVNL
ncbi:MAG: hypothetical protein K2N33_05445 [Clostridia bacterium]|nr:hypothetical protein [Clostridia bacterium]MDE7306817.1 hypothetical protein [Clostridia bacterium]